MSNFPKPSKNISGIVILMNYHSINIKNLLVERILNYGDMEAVRYILKKVNKTELKNIIFDSKNLNNKTKNFWKIMLNE